LCGQKGFRGVSFLIETLGTQPDTNAAKQGLFIMSRLLKIDIDLSRLEKATEETRRILESFGLIMTTQEKKKEEQNFRWSI
jgi:predicted ATP-grasp superfamily ATP-dependent carboligase